MQQVTVTVTQGQQTAGFRIPQTVLETLQVPPTFGADEMRDTCRTAIEDTFRANSVSLANEAITPVLEQIINTD